jgi:hypothetical protein
MDSTNTPKPYTRKRKIDQISADATEIATPLLNNNASDENKSSDVSATALSIREKLKKSKTTHEGSVDTGKRGDYRDPEIMKKVKAPVIVYNRTSRGLSEDQIRKSVEEHKRKLIGWRYHVASKLDELQRNNK